MAPGKGGPAQRTSGGGRPSAGVRKRNGEKKVRKGKASIKSQIRGCERLLSKAGLDTKAREATEAKLAKLQAEHEEHKREELERKMAVKYHKVKFFERVKAERQVKQLESQLKKAVIDGEEDVVADVKPKLEMARDRLMYVTHFPKGEKFVSIFKGEGEHIEAERKRLMELVRRQQRDLAIMTEADEGMGNAQSKKDLPLNHTSTTEPDAQAPPMTAPKGSRRKKAQPAEVMPAPVAASQQDPTTNTANVSAMQKSSRRKKAATNDQEEFLSKTEPVIDHRGRQAAKPAAVMQDPVQHFDMPADNFLMPGDDFFMADDGLSEGLDTEAKHPVKEIVPVPKQDPEEKPSKKPPNKAARQNRDKPIGRSGGVTKQKHASLGSFQRDRSQKGEKVKEVKATGKPAAQDKSSMPMRTRAEGGRKRRGKKKD